jgi:hypothetical protein
MPSKGISLPVPDTLEFTVTKVFAIDFPSLANPNNRQFVVEGLSYKSELVGQYSSPTLPSGNYFTFV